MEHTARQQHSKNKHSSSKHGPTAEVENSASQAAAQQNYVHAREQRPEQAGHGAHSRDGELSQVVANHVGLDLNLVEGLAVVHAHHGANHLGDDDHVAQVSADLGRWVGGWVGGGGKGKRSVRKWIGDDDHVARVGGWVDE